MRTTNTNNSTVVAACAALAVTAATAALQQRRGKLAHIQEEEEDESGCSDKNVQPIWRESEIKNDNMVIETQGSTDSVESLDSPKSAEPLVLLEQQVDVHPIKPTAGNATSLFQVKDICMIAAWVVCVAMAKWNAPSALVPSNDMTVRHITDDLIHQCNDEPQRTLTSVAPSPLITTENEEPEDGSNSVMVDTPIFLSAEPPTCWIVETRVEPNNGMYGPSIGSDSLNELTRLHQSNISELSGVYGSLVVDALFEMQFKSVVLEEFIKKHASKIKSKVELPEQGVYGSFLAANKAEFQTASAAVQAWLDQTVTIDTAAVYGGYVKWEGLDIPPGFLQTFSELQIEWSLHQQLKTHL